MILYAPLPLADWLAVLPATVTSPEMRPIGTRRAAIAERSNSVNVCA